MKIPSDEIIRIAFVQEWSDELLCVLLTSIEKQADQPNVNPEYIAAKVQEAAESLNLIALRGGDVQLEKKIAKTFGFEDFASLEKFIEENPVIWERYNAESPTQACIGFLVDRSMSVGILATENGRYLAINLSNQQALKPGCHIEIKPEKNGFSIREV